MRGENLQLAAATALALTVGCASVDPRPSFEEVRETVAGRHPGAAVWIRDEEALAAAEARSRELLAAPLTADAAAEVALLRNPSLQGALEGLGIARADLARAVRLANPGISFARLEGGRVHQWTAAITADLLDWLVRPLRRRVAEAELERAKLEAARALLETVAVARTTFVRYQAAEALTARLAAIEEVDRAAADYATALHRAGNLTALERANAEAGWAETRAELERARLERAGRREGLVRALGLSGDERWAAEEIASPPAEAVLDPESLEATALVERFDVAAARWAVAALERALVLTRRTRLAPLGVEVGVEREREIEGVELTGPVLELRLPLFDTGKASVARLESELARARWQLAALEEQARSEVRERLAELDAGRELVALHRDVLLPRRREVLQGTLLEHNQMLVGTFDVLVARQREIAAEAGAVQALADYWTAWYELERAVGIPLTVAGEPAPDDHGGHEGQGGHEDHGEDEDHDGHEPDDGHAARAGREETR